MHVMQGRCVQADSKLKTTTHRALCYSYLHEPKKRHSKLHTRIVCLLFFLERGLRGGADKNKDRIITARELYDFVHQGVIGASGGRQHPVMWGKFDNNMTIISW